MRNNAGKISAAFLVVSCLYPLLGCSVLDTVKGSKSLKPLQLNKPMRIELKPMLGNHEVSRYFSKSHVNTFVDTELTREKEESVEFVVESKTHKISPDGNTIDQVIRLLHKDGPVDLRTLGFPEDGEELNFSLTKSATVLKAGTYPKTSIFYVPPLSLPNDPVSVGETWNLEKNWISSGNGIPLELKLVSTLKAWVKCGDDTCADIEVSGEVSMMGIKKNQLKFESEIAGRILFSIERGVLVWSMLKNKERLTTLTSMMTVTGCMVSRLEKPMIWVTDKIKNIECKAEYEPPQRP